MRKIEQTRATIEFLSQRFPQDYGSIMQNPQKTWSFRWENDEKTMENYQKIIKNAMFFNVFATILSLHLFTDESPRGLLKKRLGMARLRGGNLMKNQNPTI